MRHLKQEFDKLSFKEALVYTLAVVSILAGLTMLFLGMYIAPAGQIHESVLTAFGIICMFVGSLLSVSMHFDTKFNEFKLRIEDYLKAKSPEP